MKYSATTVMIPDYDLGETAALLAELGYTGVEWRVRRIPDSARGCPWSPWGNVRNDLTPEMLKAEPGRVRDVSSQNGLAIAGLATAVAADNTEDIRLLAEGCASAGAPFFKVGAPRGYDRTANYNDLFAEALDAFGRAIDISRSFGVRIAVEIHRGTILVSASLAYRLVSQFSPRDIGVIYDLANMSMEGFETCRLALELLGPYLAHLHVGGHRPVAGGTRPDGSVRWDWEESSIFEGIVDYRQCFADLKSVGYDGFVSVEDFRADRGSREKLAEAIGYLMHVEEGLAG